MLNDTIDDAADTLRFRPDLDVETPSDPDATSIYDLRPAQRRAAGWDVAPELAHEERRLAALMAG